MRLHAMAAVCQQSSTHRDCLVRRLLPALQDAQPEHKLELPQQAPLPLQRCRAARLQPAVAARQAWDPASRAVVAVLPNRVVCRAAPGVVVAVRVPSISGRLRVEDDGATPQRTANSGGAAAPRRVLGRPSTPSCCSSRILSPLAAPPAACSAGRPGRAARRGT